MSAVCSKLSNSSIIIMVESLPTPNTKTQTTDQTLPDNNKDTENNSSNIVNTKGIDSVEKFCRICSRSDGKLITPCDCRGIFAFAHEECLNQWLEFTKSNDCDICRFQYITEKRTKSFCDWLWKEGKLYKYIDNVRKYSFTSFVCMIATQSISLASKFEHLIFQHYNKHEFFLT